MSQIHNFDPIIFLNILVIRLRLSETESREKGQNTYNKDKNYSITRYDI